MPYHEERRKVLDVSRLPEVAFGRTNVTWLGNVLYMLIEGTMFALVIASYFYLRTRETNWPPGVQSPPSVGFGIASAIVFLLSLAPARWIQRIAPLGDRARLRIGLMVLAGFALVAIVLRWFEFTSLNCHWTDNAYASSIWVLLGLHTGHLITEWIETLAILFVAFTPQMEGNRLADAAINSDYWYFVVVTGLISDFVIYATTRFL